MTSLLILPALLAKVVLINDLAELVLGAVSIFLFYYQAKMLILKTFWLQFFWHAGFVIFYMTLLVPLAKVELNIFIINELAGARICHEATIKVVCCQILLKALERGQYPENNIHQSKLLREANFCVSIFANGPLVWEESVGGVSPSGHLFHFFSQKFVPVG